MWFLIFVILVVIIIACENSGNYLSGTNNPNLTLDVDRMYHDDIQVTLGNLSESEFKKRQKSGYYMVQKGTEYSWLEEQRKKRVERYMKDCWIK